MHPKTITATKLKPLWVKGKIQWGCSLGGSWGVLGGLKDPCPFWGTFNLHKEKKNVTSVCANAARFSN